MNISRDKNRQMFCVNCDWNVGRFDDHAVCIFTSVRYFDVIFNGSITWSHTTRVGNNVTSVDQRMDVFHGLVSLHAYEISDYYEKLRPVKSDDSNLPKLADGAISICIILI